MAVVARPPPPTPHHLLLYSFTRCPTCDDRRAGSPPSCRREASLDDLSQRGREKALHRISWRRLPRRCTATTRTDVGEGGRWKRKPVPPHVPCLLTIANSPLDGGKRTATTKHVPFSRLKSLTIVMARIHGRNTGIEPR